MLTKEDGPGRVFRRLREASGVEYAGNNIISYNDYTPLHCIYCTSIYAAIVVLCGPTQLRSVLAVSGLAAFIERVLDVNYGTS